MEEGYIASMSEKERIAYFIAKEHLGTSFDIQKSIGYQTYVKKYIQEK
jgi:hypothetical protein